MSQPLIDLIIAIIALIIGYFGGSYMKGRSQKKS
jgi:uncharacterized protein YneF (UPF0154 family)